MEVILAKIKTWSRILSLGYMHDLWVIGLLKKDEVCVKGLYEPIGIPQRGNLDMGVNTEGLVLPIKVVG